MVSQSVENKRTDPLTCICRWMHEGAVASRMCVKASLLDVNQEQYVKCECFSDLMSVRAEKTRVKEVVLCFWCAVPLWRKKE